MLRNADPIVGIADRMLRNPDRMRSESRSNAAGTLIESRRNTQRGAEVPRPRGTTAMKARRPSIDSAVVADPDRLGDVIDAVVLGDAELQRLHRRAVRGVQQLRGSLDEGQWASFMLVEELVNGWWARSLAVVARVFFEAGVRHGRRRRGGR